MARAKVILVDADVIAHFIATGQHHGIERYLVTSSTVCCRECLS